MVGFLILLTFIYNRFIPPSYKNKAVDSENNNIHKKENGQPNSNLY